MKSRILLAMPLLLAVCFLSACKKGSQPVKPVEAFGAYDTEPDWNDSTKLVNLGYQEAQGKRIFYQYCVWCHADARPPALPTAATSRPFHRS